MTAPPLHHFDATLYPRRYETRLDAYPLRQKSGFLLSLVGLACVGVGLAHATPLWVGAGIVLLLVSSIMVAARWQTVWLYPDRIEVWQGRSREVRHRAALLGWKYSLESQQAGAAASRWLLLVPRDDELSPLMLQCTRPEWDAAFSRWVYSLPNLMDLNAEQVLSLLQSPRQPSA